MGPYDETNSKEQLSCAQLIELNETILYAIEKRIDIHCKVTFGLSTCILSFQGFYVLCNSFEM